MFTYFKFSSGHAVENLRFLVQQFLFNGFKKTQLSFLKPLYFFSGFFFEKTCRSGQNMLW